MKWVAILLLLSGCSLPIPNLPVLPTSTPVCNSHPAIKLSSSSSSIKVGDTFTLTAEAVDIGISDFYLTLSSGGGFKHDVDGTPRITNDAVFEIVTVDPAKVDPGLKIVFTLRAKAVGSADARVDAKGEVGCYNTGLTWGFADSAPLHLDVKPYPDSKIIGRNP